MRYLLRNVVTRFSSATFVVQPVVVFTMSSKDQAVGGQALIVSSTNTDTATSNSPVSPCVITTHSVSATNCLFSYVSRILAATDNEQAQVAASGIPVTVQSVNSGAAYPMLANHEVDIGVFGIYANSSPRDIPN